MTQGGGWRGKTVGCFSVLSSLQGYGKPVCGTVICEGKYPGGKRHEPTAGFIYRVLLKLLVM